jgi:hypothetical protein
MPGQTRPDVIRIQNGKITDHWGIGNLLSLMQQIGGWIRRQKNGFDTFLLQLGTCFYMIS